MSNRRELRKARLKAAEAAWIVEQIEKLPRRRGQRVKWRNEVIWERVGDDQWLPTSSTGVEAEHVYSSEHVASFEWERVS